MRDAVPQWVGTESTSPLPLPWLGSVVPVPFIVLLLLSSTIERVLSITPSSAWWTIVAQPVPIRTALPSVVQPSLISCSVCISFGWCVCFFSFFFYLALSPLKCPESMHYRTREHASLELSNGFPFWRSVLLSLLAWKPVSPS